MGNKRYTELLRYLESLGSVVLAYSGGVDSSFLLKALSDAQLDKTLAVTFSSEVFSGKTMVESSSLAYSLGVEHMFLPLEYLSKVGNNPENRCYICKKKMFSRLNDFALLNDINAVIDGSNHDDLNSHRPGRVAAREEKIISPLETLKFTKCEIRELSRILGLTTHNKPSRPCILTRFPHNKPLDKSLIIKLDDIEEYIGSLGLFDFRVRLSGSRKLLIESSVDGIKLIEDNEHNICRIIRQKGFDSFIITQRQF